MVDFKNNDIYRNIVDNMFDGVIIIGFDGKVRLDNKNAAQILELDEETLCDKTIASLMIENSRNDEFFQCIIDSVFTKERIKKTIEYHLSDGGKKYLRLAVTFLKDNNEDAAVVAVIKVRRCPEPGTPHLGQNAFRRLGGNNVGVRQLAHNVLDLCLRK